MLSSLEAVPSVLSMSANSTGISVAGCLSGQTERVQWSYLE